MPNPTSLPDGSIAIGLVKVADVIAAPPGPVIPDTRPNPTGEHAGESTCPECGLNWLVTPYADCFMPACGCYGSDSSEANPARPCESCGLKHALACSKMSR